MKNLNLQNLAANGHLDAVATVAGLDLVDTPHQPEQGWVAEPAA